MAFLGETFDANDLPQGMDYDLLPAGWYSAAITKADLKNTKDNTGQYIAVRFDITGPSHQGRVVFGNLNIKNASAKAEEIGRQQLGDIMRAIGLSKVTDTDQLIGGNLSIKVDVRAASGQYEAQNEVKGFKAISGSIPAMPQSLSKSAPVIPSTTPSKAAPPWAKK